MEQVINRAYASVRLWERVKVIVIQEDEYQLALHKATDSFTIRKV
jgi:hypothetical protein